MNLDSFEESHQRRNILMKGIVHQVSWRDLNESVCTSLKWVIPTLVITRGFHKLLIRWDGHVHVCPGLHAPLRSCDQEKTSAPCSGRTILLAHSPAKVVWTSHSAATLRNHEKPKTGLIRNSRIPPGMLTLPGAYTCQESTEHLLLDRLWA